MSVSLQWRKQDVQHPHCNQDDKSDPFIDDWPSQLSLAQESGISPGHEYGYGNDGCDCV